MSEIIINYSKNILNGTLEVLKASNLKMLVGSNMKVSIKPNMVLAKPPSEGATTHPEVVEGIILYLRELGIKDIEIIESAWIGDNTKRVYKVCGYDKLSEKYNVPIYDLKDDNTRKVKVEGYTFEVFEKALDTDFLINVPVLKAHCQTQMTCCMKNLKGCISDREKRNFHMLGLHRPIACLNQIIKTGFCVIDGICGDLTFEEGGNPVTRDMIIAGDDPLFLDSYCASLLGYRAEDIDYIMFANEMGIGKLYDEKVHGKVYDNALEDEKIQGKEMHGVCDKVAYDKVAYDEGVCDKGKYSVCNKVSHSEEVYDKAVYGKGMYGACNKASYDEEAYDKDDTKIIELNADNKPVFNKVDSGLAKRLATKINEDKACSACYSALIVALHKMAGYHGENISIGQGFRGKNGSIGCGNCTKEFEKWVQGCPPTVENIVRFLRED